jgi:hypothetical protein
MAPGHEEHASERLPMVAPAPAAPLRRKEVADGFPLFLAQGEIFCQLPTQRPAQGSRKGGQGKRKHKKESGLL